MGAFGLGDSKSSSSTTNVGVSDQGQALTGKNGQLLNPNAVGLQGKSQLNTGINLSGAKLDKGASLVFESGTSDELLTSLVGTITTANTDILKTITANQKDQLAALTKQSADSVGLVSDTVDASAGNPKAILTFAGLAIFGLGIIAYFLRKH